jgi:hypothetical protein
MTGDPQRQNFWTTLPGILTGIAAVVTAVTGLIVGVSQLGWLESRAGRPEATGTTARAERTRPESGPGPAPGSATTASAAAADDPAKEATVVITAQDGSVTSVYGDSFQHRQTGRELPLLSGQTIPFDRIKAIDVTRIDSDRARITVTLVNGAVHSGAISAGLSPYAFTGTNDLGSFEIRVDKLAKITFAR